MLDSIGCILFARSFELLNMIAIVGVVVAFALPVVKRVGEIGIAGVCIYLLLGLTLLYCPFVLFAFLYDSYGRLMKRRRNRKK